MKGRKGEKPTKPVYDWMQLKAQFMTADPSKVPDLPAFFIPLGISPNTYKNQTVGWPDERRKLREQMYRDAIRKYRQRTSNFVHKTMAYAEVLQALSFQGIIKKAKAQDVAQALAEDPTSTLKVGDPMLKGERAFKKGDLIKLFTEASRIAGAILEVDKALSVDEAADAHAASIMPSLPPTNDDEGKPKNDPNSKLVAILQDDKATKAAATLLSAIEANEGEAGDGEEK